MTDFDKVSLDYVLDANEVLDAWEAAAPKPKGSSR